MPSYEVVDKVFWSDYVGFGSNARYQSAVVLREAYRSAHDDPTRRLYGLAIFEQVMLATEDLYLVFAAFRQRGAQIPLRTLLTLTSTDALWKRIDGDLGKPDTELRALLGLPEPEDTAEIERRYPGATVGVVQHYLQALPANLHNARENRVLQRGNNVRLLNKLKHGFVAMSDDSAFESPYTPENDPDPPLTVTVLVDDRANDDVVRWGVWVGPERVEAYVATLRDYAHTSQVLVRLCLGFRFGAGEDRPESDEPAKVPSGT